MIRPAFRMILLGATVLLSTPDVAWAGPAPSVDNRQIAKQYVDAASAAKDVKDYDTAITMFQKAYELVPHPALIFDLALSYRLAGRLGEALREYKRYLSIEPSGEQAEIVRDLIAEIEATLAKTGPAAPGKAGATRPRPKGAASSGQPGEATTLDPTHPTEIGDGAGRAVGAPANGDAPAAGAAPVSQMSETQGNGPGSAGWAKPRDASSGRTLRVAGVVSGGVGIAALAVGVGFGWHARSLSNELSEPMARYNQGKYDDGDRANQITVAGCVTGSVLVVAGAVLYWRGLARDRAPETAVVAPMVSERSMGLALVGRWP